MERVRSFEYLVSQENSNNRDFRLREKQCKQKFSNDGIFKTKHDITKKSFTPLTSIF